VTASSDNNPVGSCVALGEIFRHRTA